MKISRDTSPSQEGAKNLFEKYREKHPNTKLKPQDFYDPDKGEKKKKEEAPKSDTGTTNFFAEQAKNAPDVGRQKIKDPKKLFAQAKKTHEKQLDWLNRGKGIDSVIGADVVRIDEGDSPDFLGKKGPVVVIGPLKKQDRSEEKVEGKYGGDWTRLNDIVRASIAVDSFKDIDTVVKALEKSGIKLAEKPDDRFAQPTEAGYRDLSLKVTYDNGHVGELQIHIKSILKAKEEGHKYYEKTRSIEAKAKKEGRTDLTDDEQKIVDDANAKMKALYDKAWEEATGTKSASAKSAKKAAATKYYSFEGFPAEWGNKKFPVVHWLTKKETYYDLEKFFREAMPVSKSEFEKMQSASNTDKKAALKALSVKVARTYLHRKLR